MVMVGEPSVYIEEAMAAGVGGQGIIGIGRWVSSPERVGGWNASPYDAQGLRSAEKYGSVREIFMSGRGRFDIREGGPTLPGSQPGCFHGPVPPRIVV